jgi:hypothetical protein
VAYNANVAYPFGVIRFHKSPHIIGSICGKGFRTGISLRILAKSLFEL